MDINVDRIVDVASSKDEQEVLGSSNYGTFSNTGIITQQEHDEVAAVEVAGELPTTSATDEFENEETRHQQQSPVLIDIEEEVIQHSPDQNDIGRAQQRRRGRRYILLTALLLLLAAVATTLSVLLGKNNNSSSDTAALGASNMKNSLPP